jgi:predicted HicB family RNase H-like nuclease
MKPDAQQAAEKRINLKVSGEIHRALRLMAVERGTTLQALLTEWIGEQLAAADRLVPGQETSSRPG